MAQVDARVCIEDRLDVAHGLRKFLDIANLLMNVPHIEELFAFVFRDLSDLLLTGKHVDLDVLIISDLAAPVDSSLQIQVHETSSIDQLIVTNGSRRLEEERNRARRNDHISLQIVRHRLIELQDFTTVQINRLEGDFATHGYQSLLCPLMRWRHVEEAGFPEASDRAPVRPLIEQLVLCWVSPVLIQKIDCSLLFATLEAGERSTVSCTNRYASDHIVSDLLGR